MYLTWYVTGVTTGMLVGILLGKILTDFKWVRCKMSAEEFQELCHNMNLMNKPCSRKEFEDGCKRFQDKLFGKEE